jgi:hypothetical protein
MKKIVPDIKFETLLSEGRYREILQQALLIIISAVFLSKNTTL